MPRYQRIRIHTNDDDAKLYSLILDCIKYPEHASSVKQLSFRRPISRFGSYRNAGDEKAKEEAREIPVEPALIGAAKALDLGDKTSHWLEVLSYMNPEVVSAREEEAKQDYQVERRDRSQHAIFAHHAAALLITLCPSIETIIYEHDFYSPEIFEEVLLKNNHNLLPSKHLQNLKTVKLLPNSDVILGDDRFHIKTDYLGLLRLFHRLPSLESISIGGIAADDGGTDRCIAPPSVSTVKSLSITHTDFSSQLLGSIIRVPKALESFTFSIGGRATNDGGTSVIDMSTIGRALLCHKNTLRELDLDIDDYMSAHSSGYSDDEDSRSEDDAYEECYDSIGYLRDEWFKLDEKDSPGPLLTRDLPVTRAYGVSLGSLHDFERLTRLSVGVKALLGPPGAHVSHRLLEALPSNLEVLQIRGYRKGENEFYDSQISEVLEKMGKEGARLERLKEIRGVEEFIASAKTVHSPDDDEDQLWIPEMEDDDWLEVK